MKKTDRTGTILDRYYTAAGNERQTYDLMIPENAAGRTGLIFCIHGGGWIGGDKGCYLENLKQACEERGFAAAAINYRYVSETVCFDDILDDITAALAAIRAEGLSRGVNFDRALFTGISAGGHLSLLYAYTRKETAPIRPVCVAELCGPTDLEDEYYVSEENLIAKNAGLDFLLRIIGNGVGKPFSLVDPAEVKPALQKYSPVNHIDSDTVPTLFGHGEHDGIVPYDNALALDKKLTACGVEHSFVSFPDSGHGCEDKASMHMFMELFFRCAENYLK